MTEKSLSNLHQYKLTRARYRLRSHTRKERERTRVRHEMETKGRSLRNRTVPPPRNSSIEIKRVRRTSKVRKVVKTTSSIGKNKTTRNKKAVVKKGTTNKKAVATKKATAAVTMTTAPTPTASTSTDENKYVVFDWHKHPNAYACILRPPFANILRPPYALKPTLLPTPLALSRKNNINTKPKTSGLITRIPAVNYINQRLNNQTRGGYIIGSDPSSDYV